MEFPNTLFPAKPVRVAGGQCLTAELRPIEFVIKHPRREHISAMRWPAGQSVPASWCPDAVTLRLPCALSEARTGFFARVASGPRLRLGRRVPPCLWTNPHARRCGCGSAVGCAECYGAFDLTGITARWAVLRAQLDPETCFACDSKATPPLTRGVSADPSCLGSGEQTQRGNLRNLMDSPLGCQ